MKHSSNYYDERNLKYKYETLLMRYKKLLYNYKNLLSRYNKLYDFYTNLYHYNNIADNYYTNYGNNLSSSLNDAITITKVSKISIKNTAWVITKFVLNANENVLYSSGNKNINQFCIIDLKDLGIQPGIQFSIIADVRAGIDSRNNEILEYSPDANYEIKYKLTGTTGSSKFVKLS